MTVSSDSPLISVAELGTLQHTADLAILDVQWTLGRADGLDRFRAAHLPEARFVDLDTELSAPPSPEHGRHPLPRRDDFEQSLRRLGLTRGSRVVVYDQGQSLSAARLWWLLAHAGIASQVLDGGLAAWTAAGRPVATGDSMPTPWSDVSIEWDRMPTIDADAAARLPATGVLLDARAGERYRGEIEPMDPRAGHIPGALSAPTTDNLGADGTFLPPDALRERFTAVGVTDDIPVGAYCGSGVTAAHQILALRAAGFSAALFPGSWSEWSGDARRPAATGALPG